VQEDRNGPLRTPKWQRNGSGILAVRSYARTENSLWSLRTRWLRSMRVTSVESPDQSQWSYPAVARRVIGPGAGIRKPAEFEVESDESANLAPARVVEFLKGNLADDLVAQVAPGPSLPRPSRGDDQRQKRCCRPKSAHVVASLLQLFAALPQPSGRACCSGNQQVDRW
jgi:hypothetical protein